MKFLSGIVLPAGICGKVEGFGANSPDPSGFWAAGAHFVGSLSRCHPSTFATLRVDRRADRQTELLPDKNIMV